MSRALAALLLAGLAPLAFAGPPAIGLVWWPGDPADPRYEIGREVEACLADTLRAEMPGLRLVPHQAIRDALFPRLEPATQPPDEAAFAALLAREDVRARLRGLGLGHLVAFSGGTRYEEFQGAILCGAGYGGGGCLGFAWQDQNTRLHAALWDLERSLRIATEDAAAAGRSIVPAFGLPIPLMVNTRADACRELGRRVARAIARPGDSAPAPSSPLPGVGGGQGERP
ncbi:MAG TPA: hypothetical protein VFP70_02450 [Burkholderiales bacterium]|nr:hypothetical protein [Burkholderiales bacterium]